MTNKEIYLAALRLIAESTDESDNEDYADRAYYILAAFCSTVHDINNALRHSQGLEALEASEKVCLDENEAFPCDARLIPAAEHYLGAMLTIDAFPELSDRLYDKYCDIISRIADAIPATVKKISDAYYFD